MVAEQIKCPAKALQQCWATYSLSESIEALGLIVRAGGKEGQELPASVVREQAEVKLRFTYQARRLNQMSGSEPRSNCGSELQGLGTQAGILE